MYWIDSVLVEKKEDSKKVFLSLRTDTFYTRGDVFMMFGRKWRVMSVDRA